MKLTINNEKMNALTPMNRGRVEKVLRKEYRRPNGNIVSLQDIIESGDYIRKEEREEPKVNFNRIRYNRMNAREQDQYEEKLKEKKKVYYLVTAKETYFQIPKIVYNVISINKI